MAEKGAYIRDMKLLDELNDEIKRTGNSMASINENFSNYLNRVMAALERQLEFIQQKLTEAETQLSEAQSALTACEICQVVVPNVGLVPTCIPEQQAVAAARALVAEWQMKYAEGQRIVAECQREIAEYNSPSGGRGLIENMTNNQTPKAMEQLNVAKERLKAVLTSDVVLSQVNLDSIARENPVESNNNLANDKRFDVFRNNIHGMNK